MADSQDQKASAYGGRAGAETSFRRTWDREAYAAKAVARESTERAEGKARYEAKLAGKKYHTPPPSSTSSHHHSISSDKKTGGGAGGLLKREGGGGENGLIDARSQRLDVTSQIGKTHILTGAQASLTGRRGRGAGFYCEDCDLTFKDNLQWVDHLNSRSHLIHSGNDNSTGGAEVRRATLMEVRERLLYLKEKQIRLEQERKLTADVILEERLKIREEELEKERQIRREKRRERRQRGKEADHNNNHHQGGVKVEDHISGALDGQMTAEEDVDMASLMGFHGFGTTKT